MANPIKRQYSCFIYFTYLWKDWVSTTYGNLWSSQIIYKYLRYCGLVNVLYCTIVLVAEIAGACVFVEYRYTGMKLKVSLNWLMKLTKLSVLWINLLFFKMKRYMFSSQLIRILFYFLFKKNRYLYFWWISRTNVMFFCFTDSRLEVVVSFVDIGGFSTITV